MDGYIKDGNVTDATGLVATQIDATKGLYRFSTTPSYPIKFTVGTGKLVDTNMTFDINMTADSGTIISPIKTMVNNDTNIENSLLTTMGDINTITLYEDYVESNNTDVAKLAQLTYAILKDTNATTKFKARLKNGAEANITALIDKAITEDINTSADKVNLATFLTAVKNFSGSAADFEKELNTTKHAIATIISSSSGSSSTTNTDFYLASNGVTIKCENAAVGDTGEVNGVTYTKRTKDQISSYNANLTCTSGITDMSELFLGNRILGILVLGILLT